MPHQTIAQQVAKFHQSGRLRIYSRPLNPYLASSWHGDLPRHQFMHWRGILQPDLDPNRQVFGRFDMTEKMLHLVRENSRETEFEPQSRAILCHCKPFALEDLAAGDENRYPDIPDRWDIYMLLRNHFDAFAFTGINVGAVITRTAKTYPTISRLIEWENDRDGGRYRRSRAKSQLTQSLRRRPHRWELERAHAKSALRYLGLRWLGKPNHRHRDWPDALRELGLTVELATGDQVTPPFHRSYVPN